MDKLTLDLRSIHAYNEAALHFFSSKIRAIYNHILRRRGYERNSDVH